MQALISVIVPVYNAENTIERCIRSILNQTYLNIELILVDDGSSDISLAVCRPLAQQDDRIIVFHQINQGVSIARNRGIAMSRGEWLAFVDADDYLCPLYISTLLEQAEDCELVIGGYNRIMNMDRVKNGRKTFPDAKLVQGVAENPKILDEILVYGTPWGKLFRSTLIKDNHIVFQKNLQLHEDHIFYFDVLTKVNHIKIIKEAGYNYVDSGIKSLSKKKNIPVQWKLDAFNLLSEKLETIAERFNIKKKNLPSTCNFIIRLYITAVVLSYQPHNGGKSLTPSCFLRRQIVQWHRPISIQGYIIKFVLAYLPYSIQRKILKSVIK